MSISRLACGAGLACVAGTLACGPTALVSGSDWAPTSVVADSQHVYVTNNVVLVDDGSGQRNAAGSSVSEIPLGNSRPFDLAWQFPPQHNYDSLATDGRNLYWQSIDNDERGTVMVVNRAGGLIAQLFAPVTSALKPPGVQSVAANSTGLYWANTGGNAILSVPVNGGSLTSLLPDTTPDHVFYYPFSLAVDETNGYFTSDRGDVYAFPLNGTPPITPRVLVAAQVNDVARTNIAADGSFVYWANYDAGTVSKVPIGGGDVTVIASGQTNVTGLATDGTNVYWTLYTSAGSVLKAPVGGGAATVIANNQPFPLAVALNSQSVFWTNVNNPNLFGAGFTGGASTNSVMVSAK